MNESKLIKHLPTIGRIFTPAAMLVVLTYEISTSQHVTGAWVWAILIGAAATAVGVEAVGILAGHTFEAYWRAGDNGRARLALALLGVYTIAGLVILWGNWALMPIPIIAAVVYLVSGLAESLTISQAQELATKADEAAFERAEKAKDKALERELKRQAQVDKTAVKLAQLEAKAQGSQAKVAQLSPKAAPEAEAVSVNLNELAGNKLAIYKLFREKPKASNTEIAETIGVSRQYVGQIKKELNGALKQ